MKRQFAGISIASAILAVLVAHFARFIPLKGDLVAHFLLVNEIMEYGAVRPYPVANLSAMALYPPGSHWLAAIVGWIGGSGLVGIVIVSITSLYAVYLMILWLVGRDKPVALLTFAVMFAALTWTKAQIGWEISGNFFYPQLVGDVLLFATLIWLSKQSHWEQAALVVLMGAIAMFVQPLVALHILAAGTALGVWNGIERWRDEKRMPRAEFAAALIIIVAAALLLVFHPSFRAMRQISEHDGELTIGFGHPMIMAMICALLGCVNLWRRYARHASYLDAVVGSAAVASVGIMLLQFLAMHVAGAGSEYAIKKHIFIVLTLGVINAARLIGDRSTLTWRFGWAALPLLAGVGSALVLTGFDTPVRPVLRAIAYAKNATAYEIPSYVPGEIVDVDNSQSPLVNLMVTMGVFEHRYLWFGGEDATKGAALAMVRRNPEIDANCTQRFAEGSDYVIVPPACLKVYTPGTIISFLPNGNAGFFTGNGWGMTEPWGVWSIGDQTAEVDLTLPASDAGPHVLEADARAFVSPIHPSQTVIVEVNGKEVAKWTFDSASGKRTANIPAHSGPLKITFKTPGATSPAQADPKSPDVRILGLGLKTLVIK
jgi:hypothetical protein